MTSLQQHVTQTTHKGGHILDYVITRLGCDLLADLEVLPRCLSDHNAISESVAPNAPFGSPKVAILCRRIRNIDHAQFAVDLAVKMSAPSGQQDAAALASHYNNSVIAVLDNHAPLKIRTIKQRNSKPWYSDAIHVERQRRRQCERKWLKTQLEVHRQLYVQQQQQQCSSSVR